MVNHVVLRGVLARPAETQILASEAVALRLEVRTRAAGGPAETVPVAWLDPPAWAVALDAGADVVVVGRIHRRWFRSGGSTQSRTEVVADRIVDARSRRRARQVLVDAAAALESASGAV